MYLVIEVGLTQGNYNTTEESGLVSVCTEVISMTGELECNVTVSFCTTDDSATSEYSCKSDVDAYSIDSSDGSDYLMQNVELTFYAGSMNKSEVCVNITIIDDTDVECTDVFSVKVNSTLSQVMIPSENEMSTVTITDDPNDGKCGLFCF